MDDLSLMFAVEAEQFLMAGMPDEAIELCNRGLEVYPGYAAAISVLARSYKALGDSLKAKEIIDNEKSNIPASSYYTIVESLDKVVFDDSIMIPQVASDTDSFFSQNQPETILDSIQDSDEIFIENEIKTSSFSDQLKTIATTLIAYEEDEFEPKIDSSNFSTEEKYNIDELPDYSDHQIASDNDLTSLEFSEEIINNFEQEPVRMNEKISLKANDLTLIPGLSRYRRKKTDILFTGKKKLKFDNLTKLVNKQYDFLNLINSLEKADPIKPDTSTKHEKKGPPVMITDTIAGILMQQGAFQEAKNAYRELKTRNPEKKDFYNKKIREIDIQIKS